MSSITEWFEMKLEDKPGVVAFLKGHNGYLFAQDGESGNVFRNSAFNMHSAAPHDVLCEICYGKNEKETHMLLYITFKEGTVDEGLYSLIKENFFVDKSSIDTHQHDTFTR